jgi:hypothetical protein
MKLYLRSYIKSRGNLPIGGLTLYLKSIIKIFKTKNIDNKTIR